ncbi:splicing factor PWI domain-containing protein / RNA recognition motif (RRM)-containing protein [Wolffia australiana]
MAAAAPSSPAAVGVVSDKPKEENPSAISQESQLLPSIEASDSMASSAAMESTATAPKNPNPNPTAPSQNAPVGPPRPPSLPSFTPSFRPMGAPQYTPMSNPNLVNPGYQVSGLQPPGVAHPAHMMPSAGAPHMHPPGVYHAGPGAYAGNGYMTPPRGSSMIPPPGVPRYPAPYPTAIHPGFARPPGHPVGAISHISRPPVQGIPGAPPLVAPVVRPVVPLVAPAEKPQTTVYVGKIASTVENDFLESVLRLCGPVKSWKRAENPSDGSFRGFGFCEFESAEGVLRALRLLNKLNMDGQELVLNVNQATREYLERYVEKKKEREKLKESESGEDGTGTDKSEAPRPGVVESEEESDDKEKDERTQKFGIVSEEDRDADREALEKLEDMMEQRLKKKPTLLPAPPSEATPETAGKPRERDSDADVPRNDKKDEEMMSYAKDHDRSDASPSDRAKRQERSGDRDKEKDLKREKERELERYERERERERSRREREREMRIREGERLYKELLKEWEAREREKENYKQREVEWEKERARERRREIKDQETDSDDDDTRKRRHRSSVLEERRRKRQREKEDDLADRIREEEELEEAKKRDIEEQKQREEFPDLPQQENGDNVAPGSEDRMLVEDHPERVSVDGDDRHPSEESLGDAKGKDATMMETKPETVAPSRKLGFGLMASGKRAAVPSVFHQEEDEGADKKKMRPLVPLDYSAEELHQATPPAASNTPPHLAAAAEFAKRISLKEDRPEPEKDRGRRDSHRDKSHRGRRTEEDNSRSAENKKLLDAKQLIDMIPKTKDKLFSHQINWDIYDKHQLHERMRPWISKKITEFLGEEEATLVDYIVSSTREHVQASQMLELLQSILDDEAEMFVLKMWRMLIFEIKKVETGLALKSK